MNDISMVLVTIAAPVMLASGWVELRATRRASPAETRADLEQNRFGEGVAGLLMWAGLAALVALPIAALRGSGHLADAAVSVVVLGLLGERTVVLGQSLAARRPAPVDAGGSTAGTASTTGTSPAPAIASATALVAGLAVVVGLLLG